MSSHHDPVQPTPFDVAQPVPSQTSAAEVEVHRGTPTWVLPALGGLVLLALLVIFWLPGSLEPTAPALQPSTSDSSIATPQISGNPSNNTRQSEADISPWSDAQLARLRKDAQDVLAELLELQFALQERGAQLWAAESFSAVAALATEGDAHYKSRRYEEATARYQQGLESLQALHNAIPQQMAGRLEQAQQAIEQGDADAVQSALEMAAIIEPESPELAPLQQRAAVMPQWQPLLTAAAAAETAGDLARAEQLLQQAAALDPLHMRIQSELQRVAIKARQRDFNAAMSEGYAALDEGRFDSARKSFRAAAKLQQGSEEASSALQEVATAETAQRLATLNRRGQKDEQEERWQQAVDAYEQAHKIDSSVMFASEGLSRSRARAQYDQKFRTIIDEPQRLSDAGVAKAAALLLREARELTLRGPVLTEQIKRLDALLVRANASVAVSLQSDGETEVIVYKVARLGRFLRHELTLRPGTYTAVGSRNGYRDVRKSFTLEHDATPPPVNVICTEQI
jgi:tetratricopeptide (TPR) repeat protein